LLDAITAAGGIRVNQRSGDSFVGATGQLVKASIVRGEGEDRVVTEYDLRDFGETGPSSASTPVIPGDTVIVPPNANLVYVLGEVRSPQVYSFSEGLTVIRLLSYAGGFNESTARLGQIFITREINETETEVMAFDVRENMKAGTDMAIEPGDIIYVPRKRSINLAQFITNITAPASAAMSFSSQVLDLYTLAYEAYYTSDRYDLLFDNNRFGQNTLILQDLLSSLQSQSVVKQLSP
jgi:protein involved in polysaccharide export with SLBB domain